MTNTAKPLPLSGEHENHVFTVKIWGELGLWGVPHLRAEPHTFPGPPPGSMKRCIANLGCLGKPEGEVEIDRISILTPILYDTVMTKAVTAERDTRRVDPDDHTLRTTTYLRDPSYLVDFRYKLNPARLDRSHGSYRDQIHEDLSRGEQYRQPWLGARECTALWQYLLPDDPRPTPIDWTCSLPMPFDLIPIDIHKDKFKPVFFLAKWVRGVLDVPRELWDLHRPAIMQARHAAHPPKGKYANRGAK